MADEPSLPKIDIFTNMKAWPNPHQGEVGKANPNEEMPTTTAWCLASVIETQALYARPVEPPPPPEDAE